MSKLRAVSAFTIQELANSVEQIMGAFQIVYRRILWNAREAGGMLWLIPSFLKYDIH
jgi:hypothetical protein